MRVFMRSDGLGRFTFHFEEEPVRADGAPDPPPPPDGRWPRFKAQLMEQYRKLEKKLPPAERLTARLRKVEAVEVIYPAELSEDAARQTFFEFLKNQVRHEETWKKRNAVLACLGAPLFLLPGPNVWFFYPAVRALGHYYAEAGCKKFLCREPGAGQAPQVRFTPNKIAAEG